ncbi:hypothetical protein A2333_00645 [Candidatus Wolfebacteria bacterium RIFOXYB2_FULL_49_7]|nr:MAG: hypothetical protein A2372_01800 [Candidatus Wolfebacteria bacterium RIFOXYB1_FULL_54_12]OGM94061.1 MAG: hypothetical protein A2333_00645 [Candidatus Wolfebacteria bacterium RIFOXYB2_FULL_49_7]
MFNPRTDKLIKLGKIFPQTIIELEEIFDGNSNIYIDYANVIHWQDRLGWHIDLKRLKQFLDSFDQVKETKIYYGTLNGDQRSEEWIRAASELRYGLKTKPVKIMNISIDATSIQSNSPALLEHFIKKALLLKLSVETIEFLNRKLLDLNKQGIFYIEDKKCNFDVEIGRDMLFDFGNNHTKSFILWSGDSDFADPVIQLLNDGKKVFLFATARRVSVELANSGVPIFDIKKIREFICWPREIPQGIQDKIK